MYNLIMLKGYDLQNDLKALIYEKDATIEELSLAFGVSTRTLINVLNKNIDVDKDILEKIYSYFYRHHYDLNHLKEDEYKDIYEGKILFHGAKDEIKELAHNGSRANCDFGKGFYLGESLDSANSFVSEYPNSSVYIFSYNLKDLKIYTLQSDLEYVLAISYYRGYLSNYINHPTIKKIVEKIESCDLIIAPIADNHMFYIISLFAKGEITDLEAKASLTNSSLGKQFVFKSAKGINSLKSLERLYLTNLEKEKYSSYKPERAKEIDQELKAAKKAYRGKGKYIEEILK